MNLITIIGNLAPQLAATSEGEGNANFLVAPNSGLMIWTLIAFGSALFILKKFAFPKIAEGLDRRQKAIEEAIDASARAKEEAEKLLVDYRERLSEARQQAEEIVEHARKSADVQESEALAQAKATRDGLLEQTQRDIEAQTRNAIEVLRNEVAELTITATEKVTRKALTNDDQRRLVDEALSELDFSQLTKEPVGS